ncbi:MAG: 3'-5' exonuclease [Rhodospirillales bacterium]
MLSTYLVPILDHDRGLRGYILTFEDVTRRFGAESRRGTLLQSLTEGQRSAIGGIRAAIESVLALPGDGRERLPAVFRGDPRRDAEGQPAPDRAGRGLPRRDEQPVQLPVEDVLGSDLLAAVERSLLERRQRRRAQRAGRAGLAAHRELCDHPEPAVPDRSGDRVLPRRRAVADAGEEAPARLDRAVLVGSAAAYGSYAEPVGHAQHRHQRRRWSANAVRGDRAARRRRLARPQRRQRPAVPAGDPAGERAAGRGACACNQRCGVGHDFDFHLFEARGAVRDWADLPLDRLSVTVVDTETTGLDPDQGDEIIAVGAVRIVNGRILRQEIFDSFVRPRRLISESARAIHGISQDMLRAEPTIEDVLPRLHRFVEDTVIVGHNISFDMRFFAAAGPRCGVSFANPVLCTLLLECAINANHEDKSLKPSPSVSACR